MTAVKEKEEKKIDKQLERHKCEVLRLWNNQAEQGRKKDDVGMPCIHGRGRRL